MTDFELTAMFANSLTRSKRYRVWYENGSEFSFGHNHWGMFIYLADDYNLYRVEIEEGKVKILDTSDCTYETLELADPVSMEQMFKKFEVDETAEPKPIDPIEAISSLMGRR